MKNLMIELAIALKQRVAFALPAILLLVAQSPHSLAAIYKCTGQDGKITYGDAPCAPDEKSQQITTGPVPPTTPVPSVTQSPIEGSMAAARDKRAREISALACSGKAFNQWIRAQGQPLPDNDVRMAKMTEISNQCRRPLGLPDMAGPGPIHTPKPIVQKEAADLGHPPASAGATGPVILDLGRLHGGLNISYASAISADGKLVVGSANHGNYGQVAFKWTPQSGMVSLDQSLLVRPSADATAVTPDGSVIVGAWNSEHNGLFRAFRWTEHSGMVTLGVLPGADRSTARAVSADGQVVVGLSESAFRWSERTGMVALPGRTMLGATAVSADGRIVYGDEMGADDIHMVRWDAVGKATRYPNPPGVSASFVKAVTPDGSVAVGQQNRILDHGRIQAEAVAWYVSTQQILHLGSLSGDGSKATAVNSDGTVIVGDAGGTAFRWTKSTGMESIADWIKRAGGSPPLSNPISAMGVSGDGSRIVGALQNGDPYVAMVPSR